MLDCAIVTLFDTKAAGVPVHDRMSSGRNQRGADARRTNTAEWPQAARNVGADWALLTSPDARRLRRPGTAGSSRPARRRSPGGPQPRVRLGRRRPTRRAGREQPRAGGGGGLRRRPRLHATSGIALGERSPVEDRYRGRGRGASAALGVGGVVAVEAATLTCSVGRAARASRRELVADRPRARPRQRIDEDGGGDRAPALLRASHRPRARRPRCAAARPRAHRSSRSGPTCGSRWRRRRASGCRSPATSRRASTRTAAISGWPTDRVVQEGDPILCDLGAALRTGTGATRATRSSSASPAGRS